jgi:hypothetical protein
MRAAWLQKLLDPPNRDLGEDCGYPASIDIEQYRTMYDREGVGSAVVSYYPKECWACPPNVYETEDPEETEWEQSWDDLVRDPNIKPLNELANLDEISGIGHYGVMLIGIDDRLKLDKPVPTVGPDGKLAEGKTPAERKLLYLTSFDESLCEIASYEQDSRSPRYGRPLTYNLRITDPRLVNGASTSGSTPSETLSVHWTRVLHVAEGCQTSKVFGTPRMRSSWNYLLNVRKLLGGSAEMFWKGAFPGLSYELNPDLDLGDIDFDETAAKEQMARYQNGLQRYISMIGIKVTSLDPQVADPTPHLDVQFTAISVATGIPKRVLMGSEQGELASSQDTKRTNKRVMGRCHQHCSPNLVMAFVDRLMAMGVLKHVEEYFVDWEDLNASTDTEKAEVAAKLTECLAKYVQSGLNAIIGPREFCIHILQLDEDVVDEMIQAVIDDDLLLKQLTGPQMDADQEFQAEQGDKDREFQGEQAKGQQRFQAKEGAEERKVKKQTVAKKPPAKPKK